MSELNGIEDTNERYQRRKSDKTVNWAVVVVKRVGGMDRKWNEEVE